MIRPAILLATAIAGCASAGVRTTLTGDVESACVESRAAYTGHRLACHVTGCPASERAQSEAVQKQAKSFCSSNPANTQANVAKAQGYVAQQRAIGRAK